MIRVPLQVRLLPVAVTAAVLASLSTTATAATPTAPTPAATTSAATQPITSVSAVGHVTSPRSATVTLAWTVTPGQVAHLVVRRNDHRSPQGARTLTVAGNARHITDATLRPGRTYWYLLTADDAAGRPSTTYLPVSVSSTSHDTRLSGVVTDTAGTPLPAAPVDVDKIHLRGPLAYTLSDRYGAFSLTGLPAVPEPTVVLCVPSSAAYLHGGESSAGYLPACLVGPGFTEGTSDSGSALRPGQFRSHTITLQSAGGLTGRVVDSTGAPIAYADVDVYDAGGRFFPGGPTRLDGTFTAPGLPAGTDYTVLIDARYVAPTTNHPNGFAAVWVGGAPIESHRAGSPPSADVATFTVTASSSADAGTTDVPDAAPAG